MAGPNIELSVLKRYNADASDVHDFLEEQGFEHKSDALGGRIHYHESEGGFGLTLVEGPAGSLVLPSGPIRGSVFGSRSVSLGGESAVDRFLEDDEEEDGNQSSSRGSTSRVRFVA